MNILFKIKYGFYKIGPSAQKYHNCDMKLMAKKLRETLGKTQAEMSADTGMSQATISKIETGSQNATLGTLENVASYLGVPVRDLFESKTPEWIESIVKALLHFPEAERKEAVGFLGYLSQRDAERRASEETP